jgi:transcriptional regulator with XRE-family HTH domain
VGEPGDGAPRLADRLNHLFATVLAPDAQGHWTNEAAVRAMSQMGTVMSSAYLGMLRNGKRSHPSARNLNALAALFGVSVDYFVPDKLAPIDAHASGRGMNPSGETVMGLSDIAVPTSPAALLADEVVKRFTSAALYGHSVRSYYWGAAYANAQGLTFDAELLYVAALLHDLGLTAPFDAHEVPFEVAGGEVAWVFCAGAGWPPARRQRVTDVIVKHMWKSVDPHDDPEGHLLEVGTSVDISGSGLSAIPIEFQREVTAAWLAVPWPPNSQTASSGKRSGSREAAQPPLSPPGSTVDCKRTHSAPCSRTRRTSHPGPDMVQPTAAVRLTL